MAETPVTTNAVYSAIPTVQVNGQFSEKIPAQLLSMEMREQESGMSSVELRFSNFGSFPGGLAGLVFEDGTVFQLGTELKIFGGNVASPTEIFRGKVTGMESRYFRSGPSELVVLAEDSLQAARMKRRTKTWEVSSLSDIVTQIANDLGLTPRVTGIDANNVGIEQQFNESDLRFLRRLLARYDADLQVVGDELHASPRSQVQRKSIELDRDGQLREVRILADLSHQVTQVTATGWDFQQGQTISVTSQATSFGQGSGQTGKDWLSQALTTRSEHLGQFANLNQTEAQALADAEFVQRMRRFVVAHGVAEGNPNLRVGSWLTLSGLGPRFSNDYYTTAAVHRFDTDNGYETEFTAESAYLGNAA
ncbi:MAG TPA: contractile injection system protein, VgrG/Pvc8 family [Bryobacteraceae bacterium]|jgi:phage protein D|nr:contractile injection system protein, VgrG/Pvc8 family [Bryobacteraceae bacterium]